jgi:REP element-mobilizing transposase RayT
MFSYHGHATWMPDHPGGYVHRMRGVQPVDRDMAARYRARQRAPEILFTTEMQSELIAAARRAGLFLNAHVRGCATEPTHMHVLVSWSHDREWKSIRTSIRSAMSRAMNDGFGKRDWFSDSPSRKRVRDHEHFDYLILSYLPDHASCWVREADRMAALARDAKRDVSVMQRRKQERR